jgi:hypothetical protein
VHMHMRRFVGFGTVNPIRYPLTRNTVGTG